MLAADDGPFTMLVAAMPFGRDTVATIAVPPRTWLLPPDPFTRLTGVAATPDRAPPYRLSLGAARRARRPTRWATASCGSAPVRCMARRRDRGHRRGAAPRARGGGPARTRRAAAARRAARAARRGGRAAHLDRQRDGGRRRVAVAALAARALAPLVSVAAVDCDARVLPGAGGGVRRCGRRIACARTIGTRANCWCARRCARVDVPISGGSDRSLAALLTTDVLADIAAMRAVRCLPIATGCWCRPATRCWPSWRRSARCCRAACRRGVVGRRGGSRCRSCCGTVRDVHAARWRWSHARRSWASARPSGPEGLPLVLATAARGDELALDARRADLAVLVLLVIVAGVLAALWLSGAAARQLARPIGTLRDAALAIAGGRPMPPLDELPPAEFVPVFGAFARMATDLSASRAALEEAQRRTAAVLREVASGVVARAPRRHGAAGQSACRAAARRTALATRAVAGALERQRAAAGARACATGAGGTWWRPACASSSSSRAIARCDAFDVDAAGRAAATRRGAAAARLAHATARRRRAHARRRDRARHRAARAGVGRDGAAGRARDQEPAHADPARRAAPAARVARRARRLRRHSRHQRRAHPRRDRSPGRDRPRLQPLRHCAGRARAGRAHRRRCRSARDVHRARAHGGGRACRGARRRGRGRRSMRRGARAADLAIARADELREVLLNLLENARLAEARRVRMAVARATVHRGITVRDDGDGMDPGDDSAHLRAAFLHAHERQRPRAGDQPSAARRMGRHHCRERARRACGTTLTVTLRAV